MPSSCEPFAFEREFTREPASFPAGHASERQRGERAAALAAARAEAREEALAELRGERDSQLLAAIERWARLFEEVDGRIDAIEANCARAAGELALDAADYLAAMAIERTPAEAIGGAVDRALAQVRRGVPLRVRVHPDLAGEVERIVAERQAADRRRLHFAVVADAQIVPGDCRIEWDAGALALDRSARREMVERELAALF